MCCYNRRHSMHREICAIPHSPWRRWQWQKRDESIAQSDLKRTSDKHRHKSRQRDGGTTAPSSPAGRRTLRRLRGTRRRDVLCLDLDGRAGPCSLAPARMLVVEVADELPKPRLCPFQRLLDVFLLLFATRVWPQKSGKTAYAGDSCSQDASRTRAQLPADTHSSLYTAHRRR